MDWSPHLSSGDAYVIDPIPEGSVIFIWSGWRLRFKRREDILCHPPDIDTANRSLLIRQEIRDSFSQHQVIWSICGFEKVRLGSWPQPVCHASPRLQEESAIGPPLSAFQVAIIAVYYRAEYRDMASYYAIVWVLGSSCAAQSITPISRNNKESVIDHLTRSRYLYDFEKSSRA
jgi:hypothetical protein